MSSVSIVIATYNQDKYIVRAVQSALQQDYHNIRIIIADDNSTDSTKELIEPFLFNKKITYIKNEKNIGRVANYYKLLYTLTNTEWVINLDGDDYFTNVKFISNAISHIMHTGENQVLFYQGVHIIEYSTKKSIMPKILDNNLVLNGKNYFMDYFINKRFSHMSTLYNRQVAIKSGFYGNNVLSSDVFSILQMCMLNPNMQVILSNNISGVWSIHGSNSSKTTNVRDHFNNVKSYLKLYKQAIELNFNKKKMSVWKRKALLYYLKNYVGTVLRRVISKLV